MTTGGSVARIEPWGADDLPLLEQLVGDPAMMEHLGGPERPEQIAERHARYLEPGSRRRGADVPHRRRRRRHGGGSVGYWERSWRGGEVYEIGWAVVPGAQGRGLARAATALAIEARAGASGATAGCTPSPSAGEPAVERDLPAARLHAARGAARSSTRPAASMQCNDWRLDLREPPVQ